METAHITQKIEALLLVRGEPVLKKELAHMFEISDEDLASALKELSLALGARGVCLLETEEAIELRIAPLTEAFIRKQHEEELGKALGPAAQETLAIIIYHGPVSRSRIEYIRGVGCQAILRSLLVRGLILRKEISAHRAVYVPTTELLAFLGITRIEELPEYAQIHEELLLLEKGFEEHADAHALNSSEVL